MANTPLTILSEQYSGEAILRASLATESGAFDDTFSLPAGFGDCLALDAAVECVGVTYTTPINMGGARLGWMNAAGNVIFWPAAGYWKWCGVNVTATMEPDNPYLWKASELVNLVYGTIESSSSYTLNVYFRVKRLRNEG